MLGAEDLFPQKAIEVPFKSTFACRNVKAYGTVSRFDNVLFNPFRNLFPDFGGSLLVPVLSWGIFLGYYFVIQNQVPICFLNSSDGQYLDSTRVVISSVVFYYLTAMILISFMYKSGCLALKEISNIYIQRLKKRT